MRDAGGVLVPALITNPNPSCLLRIQQHIFGGLQWAAKHSNR